jgi:hypothetical protein
MYHPDIGDAVVAGAEPNRHRLAVVGTMPVKQRRDRQIAGKSEQPDSPHHAGFGTAPTIALPTMLPATHRPNSAMIPPLTNAALARLSPISIH